MFKNDIRMYKKGTHIYYEAADGTTRHGELIRKVTEFRFVLRDHETKSDLEVEWPEFKELTPAKALS